MDDAHEPETTDPKETPGEEAADETAEPGFERPIDRFRRSAGGSVLAAGLLGVRDALEGRPKNEEAAIITEAPGTPARGNIDLVLDPDHPERSIAIVHRAPAADPEAPPDQPDQPDPDEPTP